MEEAVEDTGAVEGYGTGIDVVCGAGFDACPDGK